MKLLPLLRGSPFAFPLAALAALAMFLISESSYQQATAKFDALGAQGNARTNIQVLWRSLADAETGQRGYLLTGRKDYLRPYIEAQRQVDDSLAALNRYFAGDRASGELMQRMDALARAKLSELGESIKLFDAGKTAAWEGLLMSNIGQEQMDAVRALSEELIALESDKVARAHASLVRILLLNRIGVSAMTALSLLALYMYLRQTTALVHQREEQRQLLQTDRDHFERDLLARTKQLTELAQHLQTVREDERHRLARELHDELGALLTAAKLDVARLKSRLGYVSPEVAERLEHLSEGLNSGIALKRRIIEDLRPSSLSNLGLVAALDILVREWGQRCELKVDSEFEPVRLPPAGELTVYRLVQEALTNVSKYARATDVRVRVYAEDGQVRVSVRDNGVGFDLDSPRSSAHGLLGMRYRLESEGGRLSIESSPGAGTLVRAVLPESPKRPSTPESDKVL
ncbi:MAG: CHASE3 domain-containing protein [Pseudomonadota bacterium]|nr:CHASE3 domain-containing protein [Pseudomonadota bacterium]